MTEQTPRLSPECEREIRELATDNTGIGCGSFGVAVRTLLAELDARTAERDIARDHATAVLNRMLSERADLAAANERVARLEAALALANGAMASAIKYIAEDSGLEEEEILSALDEAAAAAIQVLADAGSGRDAT